MATIESVLAQAEQIEARLERLVERFGQEGGASSGVVSGLSDLIDVSMKNATGGLICCDDFAPQMAKILAPIMLESARTGVCSYDGKAFRFCPWCGVKQPEPKSTQ